MSNYTHKPFKRVLVANRGEIAIRVFRALNELGITSIGIYSKEDKYAAFRTKADESYPLRQDKGPIDAYLDIDTIIKIAKKYKVDAIHPGYGFLSENPDFVDACQKNGIVFIGPKAEIMRKMGDKISSKQQAITYEVPIIPGVDRPVKTTEEALEIADMVGYPVMLKASNGGGGRGMRIVDTKEQMEQEFREARDESRKAFGADQIFIEKYLRNPKHIEVQILADTYGNVVHLYDRDCSVQRRHQKVVEYAPAFSIPEETRNIILESAVRLAKGVGYENAGTLEFLVDADNRPYFIEMNPRIQVEHTITEMITGVDLVQSQILIAQGYGLEESPISLPSQESVTVQGYSIQTRVTTEDPSNNFLPDTGKITVYRSASGNGLRLDGGNACTGAVITPYYDSLLVKLISHDRTFEGAIRKSLRSLKETRIRGIKTNIPFLVNVLNHPQFASGNCYTTFIEETKELFILQESQDRATKVLEFIGNQMVNVHPTEKPDFPAYRVPNIEKPANLTGARDRFLAMGAKDFTQSILKEKKLYVTDTTMRDGQQSLLATRMRSKDLYGAAATTNIAMANGFAAEAWGGATYDTAYRFLKESPWKRLRALRQLMPNTLIQMLLRASNTVGYRNYPDNVVQEFIKIAANQGVDIFRIFDSLNWIENMKLPIDAALETGKIVEGAICYTGDILDPKETKYTLDYYVKKAVELEKLGCHIFAIKDMAGLLKPYSAKELFTALKSELHIPIHLHTHDSCGNGVSTVLMAAEAGVDIVDLAIESMSSVTSNPSMNAVVAALEGTERATGLNPTELTALSHYYADVRKLYEPYESNMKTPNTEIYQYQIPGGQYSNLQAQAEQMGAGDRFEEIKDLYAQANDLLGNIIKVTPSSKVVGDFAIFMLKNDLTKDNILTAGKDLSYPDSVIEYFSGMLGQPDGGFPEELQKIVLKDKEAITVRPGSLLPPEDLTSIEKDLVARHNLTGLKPEKLRQKAISYALYPKVYDDYCRHFEMYDDVSRLDSHVFFYGLRKGEETTLNIEAGKDLILKFVDQSDPDEKGYRTLTFEVNGAMREIRILDKNLTSNTDHKLVADKSNPAHVGSPLPGTITNIFVKEGDTVEQNAPLLTIEAMKMETTITAKTAGTVHCIYVKEGEQVQTQDLLISF